ncbi:MAG TPA: hypothetical protein VI756_15790 [Blastocatellia bacterium]
MLFYSIKPEKNGPKVEAKLRKEFGAPSPLPFDTEEEGKYRPNSVGQALGDIGTQIFGGRTRPLYTFRFDVAQPRTCEVRVHVIKVGNAVALGSLLYSTVLAKPLSEPVTLEDAKVFSKSRFIGAPAIADRLNGDAGLIGRLNKFVRTSYQVGNERIRAERFLQITPFEGKALLAINTLPKTKWFGLTSSFDAAEFVGLANTIEAAL